MTGPLWDWDPSGGPEASDNGDGTWTFTFDPAPSDDMEYLWCRWRSKFNQVMIDGEIVLQQITAYATDIGKPIKVAFRIYWAMC